MPPLRLPKWLASALLGWVLSATLAPRLAHAEVPLLRDNYYEFAPFYQTGGFDLGGHTAKATGIHIQERNGYFSKVVWTVLVAAAMAMGQSDRDYVGSTYGPGYRIDYYRMKSSAELAADAAARDAAIDGAASNEYQTDLKLFFPAAGQGDTSGYIFETYPFSFNFDRVTFDFGFAMSHIRSKCGPDLRGGQGRCGSDSVAMPFRLSWDIAAIALLDLQFDLNFLAFGDDNRSTTYHHGLRLGATLHPWQRVFVRGNVSLPGFEFSDLGLSLEAGVRF